MFFDLKLNLVKLCNIFHGGHLKNRISSHAIRNSHGATVLKWPCNPKQNTRVAVLHYKAESNVREALSRSQTLNGEGGVLTSDPCSYIDCSCLLWGDSDVSDGQCLSSQQRHFSPPLLHYHEISYTTISRLSVSHTRKQFFDCHVSQTSY